MAILDLQDMTVPEKSRRGSNRSHNRCGGGGGSRLSLLLC
jgi:Lanthionine-containing peptide SapB precursor RamS